MTILVDLDNVLINTGQAWVDILNEKYGTNVDYDDVTEWDITKFFPTLTRDEVYEPLSTGDVWSRAAPIPGAVDALNKMISDGHDVYVATASSLNTIGKKWKEVLQKFFPMIHHNNVIIANKKQMIKADVLIDDAPFNLEGGDYFGVLFDAPHNRRYELPEGKSPPHIGRAASWEDAYDWVVWCSWEPDDHEEGSVIYE